jgi:predicted Zn-dependent peptidase
MFYTISLDNAGFGCVLKKFWICLFVFWLGFGVITPPASAFPAFSPGLGLAQQPNKATQPYLDRVAAAVTEFTLENGMKFIVLEKHDAPVVSMMMYADVGAANEEDGQTGIAHYLEHLAFKGTTRVGTRDYTAEQKVLNQLDIVFDHLTAAEAAGELGAIAQLTRQLSELQSEASSYVKPDEFRQIIEQAGGTGLNASTYADSTRYYYNIPSNKLELWFSLESERFLDPVFREFYEEKEVVLEERRLRVENSPIGKMRERFLEVAFTTNPYRRPVIGYEQDLRKATRADVQAFFNTYYGPGNLIAAVVGDVDAQQVKQLAETYFGRYQSRPTPPDLVVTEADQTEPRAFTLELVSEPWYLEGYHRPAVTDPDDAAYIIMDSILTEGRTARLYKALVESQIAKEANSYRIFPGQKQSSLLLFYGLTAPGHTVEEIAVGLQTELDRLKTESVDTATLERAKNSYIADTLKNLDSNDGMANLLAFYEGTEGSWRNLFSKVQAIEAVSVADVQRVAQATFRPENRTVGKLISSDGATLPQATQSEPKSPVPASPPQASVPSVSATPVRGLW